MDVTAGPTPLAQIVAAIVRWNLDTHPATADAVAGTRGSVALVATDRDERLRVTFDDAGVRLDDDPHRTDAEIAGPLDQLLVFVTRHPLHPRTLLGLWRRMVRGELRVRPRALRTLAGLRRLMTVDP